MPVLPALLLVLAVAPPLPPAPRSPAASSTPAAQVVLVHGQVVLPRGTMPIVLTRGMLLDRTDVVRLGQEAWVALLLLNNGHVVRLDDEMSIAVETLALFKAGPVKEDAQSQLDRLLSKRERDGLGSERLIGWHQGLAAANTVAAKSSKKAAEGARKQAVPADDFSFEGSEPNGRTIAAAAKGGPPAHRPPGAPSTTPAPPPAAEPPASAAPPPPPPGDLSRRDRPAAPAAQPPLSVDAGLKRCVAQVAAALEAPVREALGTAVTLRFRLRDDEAQVSTGGALPLHPCLVAWAHAHRAQLDPTWEPLVVPLK